MTESAGEITAVLADLRQQVPGASERLIALVFDELHRIAEQALRREADGHTWQPTELVHELFLRLFGGTPVPFVDRAHFFAVAAQTIRRLLVEHARRRHAVKRDAGVRVTFDSQVTPLAGPSLDLIALDDALRELERVAPRQAKVVTLRYFGGLSVEETAAALDLAPATVKRDWSFARAFLLRLLEPDASLADASRPPA